MKIETLSRKVKQIIDDTLMLPSQGSGYSEAIHLSELGATQADIGDIVLSCENKFDVEFPEGWINDGKEKTPRDVIDTICELKDIVR